MQYLLKVSIKNTQVWRLVAVDGECDRAFVAFIIAQSFGYAKGQQYFYTSKGKLGCGNGLDVNNTDELTCFDDLSLQTGDNIGFKISSNTDLEHEVQVLKAEEHLFCMVPGCLVGANDLPSQENLTSDIINSYTQSDDAQSLDLRVVNSRIKAAGKHRKDINDSMIKAGAAPLNFKVN